MMMKPAAMVWVNLEKTARNQAQKPSHNYKNTYYKSEMFLGARAAGIFTVTLNSGVFVRTHKSDRDSKRTSSLHIWTSSQLIFLTSAEDNKDRKVVIYRVTTSTLSTTHSWTVSQK